MSSNDKNNIIDLTQAQHISPNDLPSKTFTLDNNGNGGEPPMDKYVTHEELNRAVDKLDAKIDLSTEQILHQMDKQFNDLKLSINDVKHVANSANWKANWILGILSAIIAGIVVAAITSLIH